MIEPLTLGIGVGAFLLGHIAHSTNSNKSTIEKLDTTIEKLDTTIENHKLSIASTSTLEMLDREINNKNELINELSADIIDKKEQIEKLLTRAEYIRTSGELEKLEELSRVSQNLKQIKNNLAKTQKRHPEKFNESVLVSIIEDLYQQKHNIKLDAATLEAYMNEFTGIEEEEDTRGSGSFGTMKKTKTEPKTISSPNRRM